MSRSKLAPECDFAAQGLPLVGSSVRAGADLAFLGGL